MTNFAGDLNRAKAVNIYTVASRQTRLRRTCSRWSTSQMRDLGYERVYLPLCKVADTPFHIQGDAYPFLTKAPQ